MKTKTLSVLAILSLFFAYGSHGQMTVKTEGATKNDQLQPLKIDVSLVLPTEDALRFTMTNVGKNRLVLNKPHLPWEDPKSAAIVVLRQTRGNTALIKLVPFDHPLDEELLLQPNQSISGDVPIGPFTEGTLEEVRRKHSLIVLWSYLPMTLDGRKYKRLSGHFELPAK
jgi:hypothetical protein